MGEGSGRERRARSQRGSNVLEFALVVTPVVLLMIGVATAGLALGRSVRVSQVCRDAASMFVRGVDFSKPGNQDVLVRLTEGMGMTRAGGDGVIILTKVTWVPQSKCTELDLSPCNGDSHVMTQRIVIGNPSLRSSNLGTPDASLLNSQGLVQDYMTEASAVANMPMITLEEGQFEYVAEIHFRGLMNGADVYSRAIF
jgi:hypothetical protein